MRINPSTSTLALVLNAAKWALGVTALPWLFGSICAPIALGESVDATRWWHFTILLLPPIFFVAWWMYWRINAVLRTNLREIERRFGPLPRRLT